MDYSKPFELGDEIIIRDEEKGLAFSPDPPLMWFLEYAEALSLKKGDCVWLAQYQTDNGVVVRWSCVYVRITETFFVKESHQSFFTIRSDKTEWSVGIDKNLPTQHLIRMNHKGLRAFCERHPEYLIEAK